MLTNKRIVILIFVILLGIIFGRLAIRFFLNALMGGTLFGGNFL